MKKLKPKKFIKKFKLDQSSDSKKEMKESGINREKVGKNLLSPRIYRIITDTRFIISFVSIVLLCFIAFEVFIIWKDFETLKQINNEKQVAREEIKYWENVVLTHPDYRDGYFKLATLEYRMGNNDRAKWYLEKTIELDPNYKETEKLWKILN